MAFPLSRRAQRRSRWLLIAIGAGLIATTTPATAQAPGPRASAAAGPGDLRTDVVFDERSTADRSPSRPSGSGVRNVGCWPGRRAP